MGDAMSKHEPWNRCDDCGKFIPLSDFEGKGALRDLLTPDAEGTREEWITLCVKHNAIRRKGMEKPNDR
jgi:hypothetical protein